MAALSSFKRIPGPLQLLLLWMILLLQHLAMPSQPVVIGPTGRITAGSRASFKCSIGGISTQLLAITWLKNGERIPAPRANFKKLYENQRVSYQAESTVEIMLEQGDVRSQLTCQIKYLLLKGPLQQIFALGDVLRVPPKAHLEVNPPSPVQLNSLVTVTCNTESFYPDDVEVELFPEAAQSQIAKFDTKTTNPDGTFSLKTYLEVMATEDRNLSTFLCKVALPGSQTVANLITTLIITRPLQDLGGTSEEVGLSGVDTEPQKPNFTLVQVTIGTTLTLNCTLTKLDLPTSARWYKALSNNGRRLIYKDDDHFSRGERLVPESSTDFSISLDILGPEDNGTYFCLMTKKVPQGEESSIKTQVAVQLIVPPTVRLETHPPSPVPLNASVTVTCKAEYYYPNGAKVELFCKNPVGKAKNGGTVFNSNQTYSRQSSLKINATRNWNTSLFTCLVKHNSTVIKATTRLVVTTEGSRQQYMMGLGLGLFLNKIGLVCFFVAVFKIKTRGCCIARYFFPSSES